MESRLLLDVVVRESAPILELLARKNQTLLVRGDACDGRGERGFREVSAKNKARGSSKRRSFRGPTVQGGLAVNRSVSTSTERACAPWRAFARDLRRKVIISGDSEIPSASPRGARSLRLRSRLGSREEKTRRSSRASDKTRTFFVLNLGLDVVDGVGGLHLEGDGLAGDCVKIRERG